MNKIVNRFQWLSRRSHQSVHKGACTSMLDKLTSMLVIPMKLHPKSTGSNIKSDSSFLTSTKIFSDFHHLINIHSSCYVETHLNFYIFTIQYIILFEERTLFLVMNMLKFTGMLNFLVQRFVSEFYLINATAVIHMFSPIPR